MSKKKPPGNGQGDLFGLSEGRRRRDAGMDRVKANNAEWFRLALLVIHQLPEGWTGRPEQFRPSIEKIAGRPTSNNVYGSLISVARKRGLLIPVQHRSQNTRAVSHSRWTEEYRRG